jgi:hypothetical protein
VLRADDGGAAATINQEGVLDKALPTGRYRLAMRQFQYEGEEVLFPEVIEYRPGVTIAFPATAGIRIEQQAGTGPLYRWQVSKDDTPEEIVQWHHAEHDVMILPPGSYQVRIQPIQYASEHVAWGNAVTVQPGELTTLRLDSTIQLDWTEASGPLYSWSVASVDKPKERLQWQHGNQRTMLVPPGTYQVKTYPYQYASEELAWAEPVLVKPGEQSRLRVDSSIRLDWPEESGPLYSWSVASVDKPEERLQWHYGERRTMAVPPGRYQVTAYPIQYASDYLVWPEAVTVTAGQHSAIRMDSTLQLDWPEGSGRLYSWSVAPVDKPQARLQWHYGDKRLMMLPPGSYRVTVYPIQYASDYLVWPEPVTVEAGKRAAIRMDSTVKLDVPAEFGPLYSWSVAAVAQPQQRIQWQRGEQRTMLAPPGHYRVTIEPTQYNSKPLTWPEAIETAAGKQAVSKLACGIRLVGPAGAKPDFEFQIIRQGETEPLQWARQTWTPQIVPPGTYRIEMRRDSLQPWRALAENVRVEADRIAEVKLEALPK